MTFISNRRVVATIVAASCIAMPASASAAAGSLPPTYQSDAAQSGGNGGYRAGAKFAHPQPSRAKIGDTPADFAQPVAAAPKGDTPVDHPGASRAVEYEPSTTIEVVRPERTIVRDANEALPLVLSGSALLLVLAGLGFTLSRNGTVPRPGRSD